MLRKPFQTEFQKQFRNSFQTARFPLPATAVEWASFYPTVTAPVSVYNFDTASSPVTDGIGSADLATGNTAPVYNKAGLFPGRKHVSFDNTTDNIVGATSAVHNMGTADFSVWIRTKVNNVAANGFIFGKRAATGAYYTVWQLATGQIRAFLHDGSAASAATVTPGHVDGQTIDVLYTREAATTTMAIYVDGNTANSTAARNSADLTNGALFSVNYLDTSAQAGTLQDVTYLAVFDYAMTSADWDIVRAK